MELTFDQLVKAIRKLPPEETEQLARVVERHRREVRAVAEEHHMRRIQAVRRLAAKAHLYTDAEVHQEIFHPFDPKEFVQAQP